MPIGSGSPSGSARWSGRGRWGSSISVADERPVLYSFRRCPYAIRARLALAAADLVPGRDLELREVSLKARPPELLEASPKATVPVLVAGGLVLDQSLAIMHWALDRSDPQAWCAGWSAAELAAGAALIEENDGLFKHHLDRYRYPERFGLAAERDRELHRQAALAILGRWNQRLAAGGWLLGGRPALADWAVLPFVRQFRHTAPARFDAESGLAHVQAWLAAFLNGPELAAVMASPWTRRQPWLSRRWIYHLALADAWRQARQEGVYTHSSRDRSLAEVGFIHASYVHQLAGTHARFFSDAGELVLLCIDPAALARAGVPLRCEPAPESGELFPHVYGPLPLDAVIAAQPYRPGET